MAKHGAAALNIALGAAILYLGAHAVTGRQGLVAYVDLQGQERALQARLDELDASYVALDARADRLRDPRHLDIDYLEERARVTLAAGDGNEIVFALD